MSLQVTRLLPLDNWDNEVWFKMNKYLCVGVQLGEREQAEVTYLSVLHVSFCPTVALVSFPERSLHCSSGGCQPDSDEHGHEWTIYYSSRQKEGGLVCWCKTSQAAHCHLVTKGSITAETCYYCDPCLVSAGHGKYGGIPGLEAGQWSVCLQHGSHVSKRLVVNILSVVANRDRCWMLFFSFSSRCV